VSKRASERASERERERERERGRKGEGKQVDREGRGEREGTVRRDGDRESVRG